MKNLSCLFTPFLLAFCFIADVASCGALYALAPSSQASSSNAAKSAEKKKLVRVAVMNFADQKGSVDYEYLSTSLSEAIEKTLRKKFAYERTSSRNNEKTLKKILKEKGKKKKDLDQKDIRELGAKQDFDVIVYGHFSARYQKKADASVIVIQPKLYLRFFKEVIILDEVTSLIDSSIFNVVDAVSAILFEEIAYLINLQRTLESTVLVGVAPKGAMQKKELQTEVERLKEYLEDHFKGNILELSEYLEENEKIKPPESLKTKAILNWKAQHKIQNLIEIRMFKKRAAITVNKRIKGKEVKSLLVSYPYDSSTASDQQTQTSKDAVKRAYAQISSDLGGSKTKPLLYKSSFNRGWNNTYLELGLGAGAGISIFPDSISFSPQLTGFCQTLPGLLSEEKDIGFFKRLHASFSEAVGVRSGLLVFRLLRPRPTLLLMTQIIL